MVWTELMEQVGPLVALVALVALVWRRLTQRPPRRPGYIERSPNGSHRARWRAR